MNPTTPTPMPDEDPHVAPSPQSMHHLLHELLVQRIELEMKNEELQRSKEALEVSRSHYLDLYDLAPVGYCTLSSAGLIVQTNLTMATLLGLGRGALVGRPFSHFVVQQDQPDWYRLLLQLKGSRKPQVCGLRLLHQSEGEDEGGGTSVCVHLAADMTQGETGQAVVHLAVSDITVRKQLEDQTRQINDKLEQLVTERTQELALARDAAQATNQSKSRFLACVSHDLRQPLAALSLYAGMLDTALKPGQEELATQIQHCVRGMGELLNDLLDVGKLQSGAAVPTIASFSMDDLCTELRASYTGRAAEKGLRLRCRHDPHITLHSDKQMVRRLIGNLIDNAVAHTTQGGVLLTMRRRSGKLWFEVWDTGMGIPQDQIAHVFEDFWQSHAYTHNRGSGLGLAIVGKMATLLGLQLRVRSRIGRGSVFAVTLPEGNALPATPAPPPVTTPARTIGVIEDNRLVLHGLVLELQRLGHTVLAGTTTAELLENLGQTAPDVVLCDYLLGATETGLDAIDSLRARFGAKLPGILLTGNTDPALLHSAQAKGIAVCIKPVATQALQRHIQQATNS